MYHTHAVLGHVLVYFINKAHVLVVIVELIWFLFLNILSFNFGTFLQHRINLLGSQDSEEAM